SNAATEDTSAAGADSVQEFW
ncbi:unnamed protein product, partial [Didymodactylos carnosus]